MTIGGGVVVEGSVLAIWADLREHVHATRQQELQNFGFLFGKRKRQYYLSLILSEQFVITMRKHRTCCVQALLVL
jgi:hypothetical protein